MNSIVKLSDVQIVVVAYNSLAVLPKMLASLPAGVSTVVVDNASNEQKALQQAASDAGATLLRHPINRGFGAACNTGAAYGNSQYLFFLNPDTVVTEGCIENLLKATINHPASAAFSPTVLNSQGKPAFRRRSRLLPKSAHWRGPPPVSDTEVPLLNGAAIFVSRKNFEQVGGFDESIFLYHEDDDLSLRLTQNCGPLRFVSNAIVHHAEGYGSARSAEVAALKAFHMAQSAIYAMRKHKQPWALLRVSAFAVLQAISPLTLVSKRKRAKHIAFLKGAFSVWLSQRIV